MQAFQFSTPAIEHHAPDGPGLYLLFRGPALPERMLAVYVGESRSLRSRLLAHRRSKRLCFRLWKPTHFTFEPMPGAGKAARLHRETEWTIRYRPKCNRDGSGVWESVGAPGNVGL